MKEEEAIEFLESKGYHVMDKEPYCYFTVLDAQLMLEQMQTEGKFKGFKYTDDFGDKVMFLLSKRFDATYGVTWDSLEYAIEEIINRIKTK
jgi:hypothetical protein